MKISNPVLQRHYDNMSDEALINIAKAQGLPLLLYALSERLSMRNRDIADLICEYSFTKPLESI